MLLTVAKARCNILPLLKILLLFAYTMVPLVMLAAIGSCTVTITGQADQMPASAKRRHQLGFAGCEIHYYSSRARKKALIKWGEHDALPALNSVSHPVMEADIFRIVALYHTGGYYIDMKSGFQQDKTWHCLEEFNQNPWVVLTLGFKISNWLIYSPAPRDNDIKVLLDKIVLDVLARVRVTGKKFEQKVWNLTGPEAVARYLGNISTAPAEKMCCVYNPSGAAASWRAPNSYHHYPDTFSVYKNITK